MLYANGDFGSTTNYLAICAISPTFVPLPFGSCHVTFCL